MVIAGAIALAAVVLVGALVATTVVGALARGLPDPADLEGLTFAQPTVIYDRTGKIELARFEQQDRRVVT